MYQFVMEKQMSVLSILEELANEPGKLKKIAILEKNKNNADLKRAFKLAYDPYLNFWIKKIPDYVAGKCVPGLSLNAAMDALGDLSTRKVTGHAAINTLGWILSNCSVDDAEVIERVVSRDLRCGASESTPNKVWPGIVPTFDVMLSHKDISGIKYPAYAQMKMDGARCHLYFDGVHCTAFTRSGNEIDLKGKFDAVAKKMMAPGATWDGELVCFKDGEALDRKTSNGLVNKAVKGKGTEEIADSMRFITWDIVDFTETIPYTDRLAALNAAFVSAPDQEKILPCHTEIVNNLEEAEDFFARMLAMGEEGAILKNMKHVWQPKRTKDLGKMKAEEEADLVVVGWNEGTGKYAGYMGSLECETSDGLLNVNVSGWSDEDRKNLTEANTMGKILTVMYNAIIDSKGKSTKSLFLPRAVEFRFDKTVANKLGELK
jgi:hypothetical protein